MLETAIGVLLSDEYEPIVDIVLCARDGAIEAHARDGSVQFTPDGVVLSRKGRDPLEHQDPGAFTPLDDERANIRPPKDRNHYPFAFDNVAHLFASPNAPDLAVVHSPSHNWEERGGHRGEHGSLDIVQSRAPLVISGAGVEPEGMVARGARMIDIAPTLATLAGVRSPERWQGHPIQGARAGAEQVVAFLCDGTNPNVLYAMAAAGELPNVARLMDEGTTYAHGCIASFPSVTLANHTTAVTGVHPGSHGVLNNFYYDRARGEQVIANSPQTWHLAHGRIAPDARTIFEAAGGFTAAVNEPADRGATYATFDLVRAAGGWDALQASVPSPSDIPGQTPGFEATLEYGWSSAADHLAVQQATQLWKSEQGNPRPSLMWINLILPDAANHAGGPYSEIGFAGLRDTDARLGRILDAMDWGGGETTFLLFADHGMEETDPGCKGDWSEGLARAGLKFRDEGEGFIYLNP